MRIEPPAENPVMEVTYEGMEVVQPPLTMSENLSRLARKIDFLQEGDMEVEEEAAAAAAEEAEEEDHLKSFHQPGKKSTPHWRIPKFFKGRDSVIVGWGKGGG